MGNFVPTVGGMGGVMGNQCLLGRGGRMEWNK